MRTVASRRLAAPRRYGAAAMAALAALLTSCGGQASPTATIQPTAAAGPDAVQLRITQVVAGRAVPIEGAISYLRIEHASGATVVDGQLPASKMVALKLRPGKYRLESWQRVCAGNCGHLDPPSDRCARDFPMRHSESLDATIRVNFTSGCVITLRRQ